MWHTTALSTAIGMEENQVTYENDKRFFPLRRDYAFREYYKMQPETIVYGIGDYTTADAPYYSGQEGLNSKLDIPNWHAVKMMPIHAKDEPFDLTALIQVTYFATYEFEHTENSLQN